MKMIDIHMRRRTYETEPLAVRLRKRLQEIDIYIDSLTIHMYISVHDILILEARELLATMIKYAFPSENTIKMESQTGILMKTVFERCTDIAELDEVLKSIHSEKMARCTEDRIELHSGTIKAVKIAFTVCEDLLELTSLTMSLAVKKYAFPSENTIKMESQTGILMKTVFERCTDITELDEVLKSIHSEKMARCTEEYLNLCISTMSAIKELICVCTDAIELNESVGKTRVDQYAFASNTLLLDNIKWETLDIKYANILDKSTLASDVLATLYRSFSLTPDTLILNSESLNTIITRLRALFDMDDLYVSDFDELNMFNVDYILLE